jgi:Methyltransferase domain
VERHGPWTSHDVQLADGVSTRPGGADFDRLRRCLQIAVDVTATPLEELRVLDLGALEGQYAIEFAAHGATAVAIEGREANIEKARLAKEVLGLERLELRQEDVRSLSRERHGSFDVVLCLGLLYHLDADDILPFLGRLADVCTGVLILDTHVALRGSSTHVHDGWEYRGLRFVEHDPRASGAQRARSLWASLDNAESFWPTRASLLTGLMRVGFTSVMTADVPVAGSPRDRLTLVALKGSPVELRSVPRGAAARTHAPEQGPPRFVRNQSRVFLLAKRVALRALVLRERLGRGGGPGGARPS